MSKQQGGVEVGYILLEECDVLVPIGALHRLCNDERDVGATPSVWHTLDVSISSVPNNNDSCVAESDLVLQPCSCSPPPKASSSTNSPMWRNATPIIPFNGMLSEVRVAEASSHGSKSKAESKKRRRSDASLLVGLAMEINMQAERFSEQQSNQLHSRASMKDLLRGNDNRNNLHLRNIRMQTAQIMFWGDSAAPEFFSNEIDGTKEYTRVKASLLITFAFPLYLLCNAPNDDDDGSNSSRNVVKPKKTKDKMLSSAHQLLGSIIRCDWEYLDRALKKLSRKVLASIASKNGRSEVAKKLASSSKQQEVSSTTPLFPDVMNVEELYTRISGAGQHFSHTKNNDHQTKSKTICEPPESQTNAARLAFSGLPEDIVANSIAPFLRARTLHALRATNRKLYESLRAIVPGIKLRLFHHQLRSLEWMEMRERRCVTEGDILSPSSFLGEGEAVCGGDLHRAVTGGATVLLRPRPNSETANKRERFRFEADSGAAMDASRVLEQRKTQCARGGLLCDDPGLGKTITVISLILRTFGLSTEASAGADRTGLDDDDSLFHDYWSSSFLTEHVRKPALLKLITRLIKSDKEAGWFVPPIDDFLDVCPDYLDIIEHPISLQQIRNTYSKSDCRDFRQFESDVRLCFTNAMTYNPLDDMVHLAAERLSKNFAELVREFKTEHIQIASKSKTRMANDPSVSSLLDRLELRKQAELQEPLVPSSSTLLVVPNTLLLHWQQQMLLHIDFGYLSRAENRCPPIYYHTSKRNIKNQDLSNITFELRNAAKSLIFIDDGSKQLPSPEVLASFAIVLTSYNRFTTEWKNGSVESEIRASQRGGANFGVFWGDGQPKASGLLKVKWLRVIVDEGHVMGKSTNNLIQFASWLTAQRHWGMTGTPTSQIATKNGLKSLYYLANFVHHEFFNKGLGREKIWNGLIAQGWTGGNLACFYRLKNIVSYLMVRHTKKDLIEIPPPAFSSAFIDLSQEEVTTYNTIVQGIRTNIITTSMQGKTSGWQDSLLNPRQSKHASQALTNLRIACCGGTRIIPQILSKHWAETLQILTVVHNLNEIKVKVVNDFILRAQSGELSGCHCCGIQLQILFVIPCGHLVCSECINNKTVACPVCEKSFDVDDFQRLQPGLVIEFNQNLETEKQEREKQNLLRRALDTAPQGRQGRVIDIDELEDAAETNALTNRPLRTHRKGESCEYSCRNCDGKCTVCGEEHFDCNFMATDKQQCSVCFKYAEECPSYASKASYVIDKLLKLRNNDFADDGEKAVNVSPMAVRFFAKGGDRSTHRPLKAIVFSQFRPIYEYFGDRLIRRFGGACVADYSYAKGRIRELHRFIHEPDCFVMLLSMQGSVGLDLSFVTHIFFLDSIYDKSLEAQVVARAYRMGATGPVHVEHLTAKDSVEEVMNQMNDGLQVKLESTDKKEKHAKLHTLLKSATLIRPKEEQKTKRRKLMSVNQQNGPEMGSKQLGKSGGVRFID